MHVGESLPDSLPVSESPAYVSSLRVLAVSHVIDQETWVI